MDERDDGRPFPVAGGDMPMRDATPSAGALPAMAAAGPAV